MISQPDDRLIAAKKSGEDHSEGSIRPLVLADFIGQEKLRHNLNVFIKASCDRQEALDHILFYGPPGLGKTTLAQIVARELGVGFQATSGPILAKGGDLAAILSNLQPHDVLFIDEIHRLNAVVEEILYPAMEDFKLDLMIGEGPGARSVRIDIPPFTLIGATTRSGLLTTPLRDRFGIPLRLDFYQPKDLKQIIERASYILGYEIDTDGALEIAKRSRGTPRIAGRLLRRVRDFASVADESCITAKVAHKALQHLEVDEAGLDAMDKRYLTTIATVYKGGPVGIDTLAAILAEERDVIEDVVEPFLIQQGFIQRTPRGRVLCDLGWHHVGLTPPSSPYDQQTDLPLNL